MVQNLHFVPTLPTALAAALALTLVAGTPAASAQAPPVLPLPMPEAAAPDAITDVRTIDHETFQAMVLRVPDGQAPRVDGRLDEAIWAEAPKQGNFIQREPAFGAPGQRADRVPRPLRRQERSTSACGCGTTIRAASWAAR